MCIRRLSIFAALSTSFLVVCLSSSLGLAQSTQFSYQGLLNDGGSPANGSYDLQFRLFDAAVGGTQVGSTIISENVTVNGGLFKVVLDFGGAAFPGASRWLEIAVRPGASSGAFTPLVPLQPLTASPYAMRSLNAATADSLSVACINCVTSGQINTVQGAQVTGGIAGSQIAGAIPVASVPAGSANYVQNTITQQVGSNFNISGNGTAAGTLAGNIVNAATQYNLGGVRVLSTAGTDNIFVGAGTGAGNTDGNSNSFFGRRAGEDNTTGSANSFFGYLTGLSNSTGCCNAFFGGRAGFANTTSESNSFFGFRAGEANTSASYNSFFGRSTGDSNTIGEFNSFFGVQAGDNNTSGSFNTFIGDHAGSANATGHNNTIVGSLADVGAANLTYATAIGAGATVSTSATVVLGRGADTVRVPGTLNVSGALTASGASLTNLNANNITSGTLPIARGGTGSSAQNFVDLSTAQTITGTKNFSGNLGIGTSSPVRKLHVVGAGGFSTSGIPTDYEGGYDARLHVVHGSNNWGLAITRAANDTGNANLVLYKTRSTDAATPTAVQTGDSIGRIQWQAPDDANVIRPAGEIAVKVDDVQDGSISARLYIIHNASGVTFSSRLADGSIIDIMTIGAAVFPVPDGSINLGGPSNRWAAVYAANGTIQTSDARLKREIAELPYGLREVLRLRPVSFAWKDRPDGRLHLGLLAQEVEPLIPAAVVRGDAAAAPLGMNYSQFIPVLIKAVQEQQAAFNSLKAEKAALTARLEQQSQQQQTQLAAQQQQNARLQQQLEQQQGEIAALQRLVCLAQPQAAACQTTKQPQ